MAKETTTSIKMIDGELKIIESTYTKATGKKNLDYSTLHRLAFQNCLNSKKDALKAYNRVLDDYNMNNIFNVFITLSAITPKHKGELLKKLKTLDPSSSYVCLAAWTLSSDLHYHIAMNTTLDLDTIKKTLNKCDAKAKEIYDQYGLFQYFKKNINYDTIWVLKQTENTTLDIDLDELREKQLQILNYTKTLTASRNIGKAKVTKISNVSREQIEKAKELCEYKESVKFSKNGSDVKIDKFTTNDTESVINALTSLTIDTTKVEESIINTTSKRRSTISELIANIMNEYKDSERDPLNEIPTHEYTAPYGYKVVSTAPIPKEAQTTYNKAIVSLNMPIKSTSCIECS